ncbi:uncharacterized protein PG998_014484 [Apiospora kogelbergensis]|uniref:uncharacterized protein n=1 Tax=Apiospora kogelbergensis TaxID=1337665 RepID=UPI00312EB4B8
MEMGFEELKMIAGKVREEGLKTKNEDGVLLDQLLQRRVTASKSDLGAAEVNNNSTYTIPAAKS